MAETALEVEWYVAREGRQHGPLTDTEMQKFVELGHLRPTDLVWRTGFPDWRPGAAAFPNAVAAAPTSSLEQSDSLSIEPEEAPESEQQARRSERPMRRRLGRPSRSEEADDGEARTPTRTVRNRKASREGGIGRGIAVAAVVLFTVAGLGWLGWQHSDGFKQLPSVSNIVNSAPSIGIVTSGSAAGESRSPFEYEGTTAETVDASLQKTPIWRRLKSEYPDWYGERIHDVTRMQFERRETVTIQKHLAEQITALRRKNADAALSSSLDSMRRIVSAFLDNLDALNTSSPTACADFISQGEVAYVGFDNLTDRQLSFLQRQLNAVFDAVAEGRKSPQPHEGGKKADYDFLASELIKAGWSQTDLQIFSDPRLLARSEPVRLCQMVRDWFKIQLTVRDPELLTRFLTDNVRPLVAG